MPTTKLQWTIDIAAPVATVWSRMLDLESYKDWTSAFGAGSYYVGSWDQGARIVFTAPPGEDGMLAEIAENRRHQRLSIRHIGVLAGGVEDTESEMVRAWAPAYETYTFETTPTGTHLVVDLDITDEYAAMMQETWPKALDRLREISEA